jgi:hypothetical protein
MGDSGNPFGPWRCEKERCGRIVPFGCAYEDVVPPDFADWKEANEPFVFGPLVNDGLLSTRDLMAAAARLDDDC